MILNNRYTSLGLVFLGKAGGILTNFLFYPLYKSILGIEAFGVVVTILSVQSILLILDFGFSTLVGNDVASENSKSKFRYFKRAENILSLVYLIILLPISYLFIKLLNINVEFNVLLCCMVSFLFLTLQNIAVTYLIVIKKYSYCSFFQVLFALFKGAVTLLFLKFLTTTVDYFVYSQVFTAVIGYFAIRYLCKDREHQYVDKKFFSFNESFNLLKRGFPVLISSVSVAVVMQLDKSLISYFNPSEVLTPYFFAFTYCMSPILIVAQPIKQYFHPIIKFSISSAIKPDIIHSVRSYLVINTLLVFIVFLVLYLFNYTLLLFWLNDISLVESVYRYTSILLPAIAFSSISYVPVVILICLEDFNFQAKVNITTAVILFLFTFYYSMIGNVENIVLIYAVYFFITSLFCWLRLSYLFYGRTNLINR